MTSFSLYLLALHLLGDFPLQTDWMAARKIDEPRVRLAHVGVYTAVVSTVLWATPWPPAASALFIALVATTHYVIDSRRWKDPVDGFETRPIWFDQAYHIISLAAAVAIVEVIW
ncbi:DUF3307 domain-containing protein [Halorussus marinus]|uniref:DUF3307 domain-containing protein n=1 Tax=Halorussus marinus TaxID=2505976 RepID=UPI00106EAC88|nr:DUF3307 domain-containing protein [Halorussus marinus]